ncbi:hypothetical protein P7C70_g5987, partial [Phenoliferia sp. Uapishka_3]
MNTTLPNTIKALKTQPGNTIAVVDLPFGTRDDVKHLAPDSVVVKVRACGCNPTDYKHAFDEWRPADPNAEFVCGCDGAGDSIKASGGQVITTLPVTDEQASRRENVSVEFTLVYSELGYALTFANAIDMPAMPEDARLAENWVTKELPALLEGWKDGKSSKLIGAKLRENSGGLEGIIEGLKIMQKGEYAAEKLVYDI